MNLFAHMLWLSGCVLGLMVMSRIYWEMVTQKNKFQLEHPILILAAILFSGGLAVLAPSLWQTMLWLILAVLFIFQLWFKQ